MRSTEPDDDTLLTILDAAPARTSPQPLRLVK
jgi:hypothetical protein